MTYGSAVLQLINIVTVADCLKWTVKIKSYFSKSFPHKLKSYNTQNGILITLFILRIYLLFVYVFGYNKYLL